MKHMKWWFAVILVGSLFALFSCTTGLDVGKPPPKTPQLLSLSTTLYQNNCSQCHGLSGQGDGPFGTNLRKRPMDFTLPFDQWNYSKGDPQKIFEVLKKGIPDTPMAMFRFTDEQRWALVYRVMEFSRGNGK
jgi:high-affinity iron transporter